MSVESFNSPDNSPSSYDALSAHELKAIAARSTDIANLTELLHVARKRSLNDAFDVKAADLVVYVKHRIKSIQDEKDFVSAYEMEMHERNSQDKPSEVALGKALEDDVFDNADPVDEDRLKKITDLFPNNK
ncbi:MAG: hypothetical protein JWN28_809 [Candidatus Saccharibacteria bacterium]|nr:hypothetical protein [Candidatus Saccharibacteria bacterium]